MATRVSPASHSTSNSPVGSPGSSARTHKKLLSGGSHSPFEPTSRISKRKSWQTSDTAYLTSNWLPSANPLAWDSTTSDAWSTSKAVVETELPQMHGQRSLLSKTIPTIGNEDNLLSAAFDDASHKYSPASSARNSVQSVPVTTPSLMGSMDSSHDYSSPVVEPQPDLVQHGSAFQSIAEPNRNSGSYTNFPQLTIQTNHLPQPQSPLGEYGAHFQPPSGYGYPPSRNHRYQPHYPSFTSPTQSAPPLAVYNPMLQHQHNPPLEYFRRPPTQMYYPDYITSPTAAAPSTPSAFYFATAPVTVTWNQPHTPSAPPVPSSVNGQTAPPRRQTNTGVPNLPQGNQYYPFVGGAMRPFTASNEMPNSAFVSPPMKGTQVVPQKSVALPARSRNAVPPKVTPEINGVTYQSSHVLNRTTRREQRESLPAQRSALLEDFRNNRNKRWDLQDIAGHVVEFSSDQHGSRFIQHKLLTAHEQSRNMVYREIVPANVRRLAQDVFGNYVLQKMCELGTPEERIAIARTLQGHLITFALNMYGCRVLQKMIDFLNAEEQSLWLSELNGHILQCVKDANGNHVIQKFLESPLSDRSVFITAFQGNVFELATHPYGCRVLQRCFEHVEPELTRPLLNELHTRAMNLMQDQYGNYVMQFLLEKGSMHDRNRIIQHLIGHMLPMSKHKFASNVCEKAVLHAPLEQRKVLIEEISAVRPDGMNPMITMIKDQYANYVLQRALEIAEGKSLESILTTLRPQLNNMRRHGTPSPFAKHVSAVEKILRERHIDINAKESIALSTSDKSESSDTPTGESNPPGLPK